MVYIHVCVCRMTITYVPVGDTHYLANLSYISSVQTDYAGEEKWPGTDCSHMITDTQVYLYGSQSCATCLISRPV